MEIVTVDGERAAQFTAGANAPERISSGTGCASMSASERMTLPAMAGD